MTDTKPFCDLVAAYVAVNATEPAMKCLLLSFVQSKEAPVKVVFMGCEKILQNKAILALDLPIICLSLQELFFFFRKTHPKTTITDAAEVLKTIVHILVSENEHELTTAEQNVLIATLDAMMDSCIELAVLKVDTKCCLPFPVFLHFN